MDGSASLEVSRLRKIWEGLSQTEELLKTWSEGQTQKRVPLSTMMILAKEKVGLSSSEERLDATAVLNVLLAPGGLTESRIVIHYIMWK